MSHYAPHRLPSSGGNHGEVVLTTPTPDLPDKRCASVSPVPTSDWWSNGRFYDSPAARALQQPHPIPLFSRRLGIAIGRTDAGLQVGDLVRETAEALWLDIPFPQQSHLRAWLLKRKRPFAPNDGVLYTDSRERRSHWVVNILWTDVMGVLVVNGRQHPYRIRRVTEN